MANPENRRDRRPACALLDDWLVKGAIDPDAQGAVGISDNSIPRELIYAHGLVPQWVEPVRACSTAAADIHLEEGYSFRERAMLSQILNGELAHLELLVLGREYAKIFYYAAEFRRRGMGERFPPILMFDLLRQQDPSCERYNRGQVARLDETLARITGRTIEREDLLAGIDRANRVRSRLREIQAIRWEGRLRGAEGFAAMAASYWMPDETYLAWADDVFLPAARADEQPASPGGPRLILAPHAPLPGVVLHELLEAGGFYVACENDWLGSCAGTADVVGGDDPLSAICRHVWRDTFSHDLEPREPRQRWLKDAVQTREVDGVVFHIPPDDKSLGWDFPDLRTWLQDNGKDVLLLDSDLDEDGVTTIERAIAQWLPPEASSRGLSAVDGSEA